MSSTNIVCNRQIGKDGATCGRPIVPVFGAWPEECTNCATRVMVNTKEGREAFAEILEQQRTTLRRLAVTASLPGNVWRVDGLELRERFRLLDELEAKVVGRQRMRAMNIAQRLSSKGETSNEPRRSSLGHMWNKVPQERAMELKQAGYEVRYIGVAWQVKVS